MKMPGQFCNNRTKIYENAFSAKALFITGLVIIPALLFNPVTLYRVLLFLFFWFLAWLSGKKTNPVFTIMVLLCIVAFNLILPYGRVLFSIGMFKITSGSLTAGIHRAATLGGLIMLSRFTIRRDLKFPGPLGELISDSFRIFALIMDNKQRITRKNFIADIDALMIELSGNNAEPEVIIESRTKPFGFVVLVFAAIISWLPML